MPDFSEFQQRLSEKIKTTPPVRVIVISFVLIILVGTALLMLPISSKVGGPAWSMRCLPSRRPLV